MMIEICLILCSLAMIFQGCSRQDGAIEAITKDKPHTIIIPNVVECKGHIEREGCWCVMTVVYSIISLTTKTWLN